MIDTPEITKTTTQQTAIIHLTIPRGEMPRVFGPAVGELMAAIAAQGIAPAGPVFTHHLKITSELFDFELSVPVASPIVAQGRVRPSEWPAMKVARTVYHGPYEGLSDAWGGFMAWMKANAYSPAEELWESYVTGPHTSPDASTWRTELSRPLLG